MTNTNPNKPMHLSDAIALLNGKEPVDLVVLKADGCFARINGCVGLRHNHYAGTRHVKILASGQVRQIRDVLILSVNGIPVYC